MGRKDKAGQFTMQPDSSFLVVLVTVSSEAEADLIVSDLLSKKLAACVNVLPVQSAYLWEGKVQSDRELQLIIKTQTARYQALEKRVLQLHSYDVPEIIALPIQQGSSSYLTWISQSLKSE